MKAIRTLFPIILSTFVLTACETIDEAASSPSVVTGQQAKLSQYLSPRTLSPGECGLFVWAGTERRFILFVQARDGAQYASENGELALTPIKAESLDAESDLYGQTPVQAFQDETGRRYDLNLTRASEIKDGIRYLEGHWRYKNGEGWQVITPVYGVSTCQVNI
ncbi:MAG: hypothetical protein ABJ275_05070 [Maricaulaceae bacterium]